MKKLFILLLAVFLYAGPYTNQLSKCLIDSTSKKDKIILINWIFAMYSAHPNIKIISIPQSKRDIYYKKVAKLFVRLLTEDCKIEFKEALKYEGKYALSQSFSLLGQVSARELISNPLVTKESMKYLKYIDKNKFEKLLK